MMEIEVERLIKLIKKKKPEALERVMDMYMGSVYGVAKSILSGATSESDVEECVQDVFMDAWNNIEKYDPERGSFKTWLLILCKYRALTIRKGIMSKAKVINLEEVQLAVGEDLEEDFISRENRSEIIAAIRGLGGTDSEIFLRRYILGHSVEEICLGMKLTRQAVDNRLWRGRKKLRDLLESGEGRTINE